MTILFLDQFSDMGGAQRCLLDLLPEFQKRGFRTVVAAPGDGPLLRLCAAQGAQVESIRQAQYGLGHKSVTDFLQFGLELPRLVASIRRLVERHDARLLYVNGPRMLPAAGWVSRSRIPLVFHAHNRLNQRYAAWMAGQALRRSRATVIASCRFVAEPLLPFLEPGRTHIVYNGVADHGYQEHSPNGLVHIGVIGRIAPEKGQRCFVDAAGLLAATRPDFRFVVIGHPLFGNAEADLYFERLREAGAGLPVEFAGWTDDVPAALAGLDLLVVPSTGPEATTRVIPEAWSAGVPVLASESGGITEIVEDGANGFLVPPSSARALADRMGEVMSLPKDRILAVTRAARQLYEQRFTGQDYGAAICGLVARILGQ